MRSAGPLPGPRVYSARAACVRRRRADGHPRSLRSRSWHISPRGSTASRYNWSERERHERNGTKRRDLRHNVGTLRVMSRPTGGLSARTTFSARIERSVRDNYPADRQCLFDQFVALGREVVRELSEGDGEPRLRWQSSVPDPGGRSYRPAAGLARPRAGESLGMVHQSIYPAGPPGFDRSEPRGQTWLHFRQVTVAGSSSSVCVRRCGPASPHAGHLPRYISSALNPASRNTLARHNARSFGDLPESTAIC